MLWPLSYYILYQPINWTVIISLEMWRDISNLNISYVLIKWNIPCWHFVKSVFGEPEMIPIDAEEPITKLNKTWNWECMTVRLQWLQTQFSASALTSVKAPAVPPTTSAPSVQMSTQAKRQITFYCH